MSLIKGFVCQVVGALFYNLTIDYVLDANRKANVMKDEVATVALACVVSLFCFGVQVFTDKTEDDDSAAKSSENTDKKTKKKEVSPTKETDTTSQSTKAESMHLRETTSVVKEPMGEDDDAKLITTVTPEPPITETFKRTELTAPELPLEALSDEAELSATVGPEPPSTEPSKETESTFLATPETPLVVASDEPKHSATVMPEPPVSSAPEEDNLPKTHLAITSEEPNLSSTVVPEPSLASEGQVSEPPLATAAEEAAATDEPKSPTEVMAESPLAIATEESRMFVTIAPEPLLSASEGHIVPKPPLAITSEEPKLSATVMTKPPLAAVVEEPRLIATVVPEPAFASEGHVPKPPLAIVSEEAATTDEPKLSAMVMAQPPLAAASEEPKLCAPVVQEAPLSAAFERSDLKELMSKSLLSTTYRETGLIKPYLSEISRDATNEENEAPTIIESTEVKNTIILEPQLTVSAKETEFLINEPPVTTSTEETELMRPLSETSLDPTSEELTITITESAAPQETDFVTAKIPETSEAQKVDLLTSTEIAVLTENTCMVDGTTFETLETVSGEMKEIESTSDEISANMDNVFSSSVDTVVSASVDNTPIRDTKLSKINAGDLRPVIGAIDLVTFSPLIWTESELKSNEEVGIVAPIESLELAIEDVEVVTSNTVEVSLGSFKEELKDMGLATEESLTDTHTLASTETEATEKMVIRKSSTNLSTDEVNEIELATEELSTNINALSSAESIATMIDETVQNKSADMTQSPAETDVKNPLELGESTENMDVTGSVTVGLSEEMKVLKEVDITVLNVVPTSNAEEINTTPQVLMGAQQTNIQIEKIPSVEDRLDTASSVTLSTTEETDLSAITETEETPVEELNEVLMEMILMSDGDKIASSETGVSSEEMRINKLTETDMLTEDSNATESKHSNALIETVETTTNIETESIEINAAFSVTGAGNMDMVTSSKTEELSTEVDDSNILTETVARPTQDVKAQESIAAEILAKKLDTTTTSECKPDELGTTSSVELDSPTLIIDRWPTVTESLAKFREQSEDRVMSTLTEESKAKQERAPSIKENVSADAVLVASETSEAVTIGVHTPSPRVDVSFLYTLPNS